MGHEGRSQQTTPKQTPWGPQSQGWRWLGAESSPPGTEEVWPGSQFHSEIYPRQSPVLHFSYAQVSTCIFSPWLSQWTGKMLATWYIKISVSFKLLTQHICKPSESSLSCFTFHLLMSSRGVCSHVLTIAGNRKLKPQLMSIKVPSPRWAVWIPNHTDQNRAYFAIVASDSKL